MKKSAENRYPHCAELFKFCKEALNIKHNFEVKVIDQHVGAILGYDPADCSHWKKGKKNIKSLQVVNTIAGHLEIDSRFVTDIISGKADLEESLQEFRGYGPFGLSGRFHDEVKREYFRNPGKYATVGGEARSFEQVVDLGRQESLRITRDILARADVQGCPVFLPELSQALLPRVRLEALDATEQGDKAVELTREGEVLVLRHRAGEGKHHLRTLVAREIGRALLVGQPSEGADDELTCARINLFAALLLVPGDLLQKAMRQLNHARDLVGQLSEIFWVGRTVINARLKDFVENGD